MTDLPLWILSGLLLIALGASALMSAAGTSLLSLNRQRLKRLQGRGRRRARRVRRMLKRPDQLLGALFVGGHLATIVAALMAALIGYRLMGWGGAALAMAALAVLQLIFAETLPKRLASRGPERFALSISAPIQLLVKALYPIVAAVNAVIYWLLRDRSSSRGRQSNLSVSELRSLLADPGQLIPEGQQQLLLRVLELEQLTVDDVMVPRAEIVGVDIADEPARLHQALRECPHAVVPVFRQDLDAVIGFFPLRNIGKLLASGPEAEAKAPAPIGAERLTTLSRPAYFVPEGTPLRTQLHNFRRQNRREALVVDEYGSVLGLLTLEDLLEQVVAIIATHRDDHSLGIVPQDDGSWVVDGAINLRDLNRQLGWDLDLEGPKTLSGLLLEHLETFPEAPIGLHLANYGFEVIDMEGRKIKRVRVFQLD